MLATALASSSPPSSWESAGSKGLDSSTSSSSDDSPSSSHCHLHRHHRHYHHHHLRHQQQQPEINGESTGVDKSQQAQTSSGKRTRGGSGGSGGGPVHQIQLQLQLQHQRQQSYVYPKLQLVQIDSAWYALNQTCLQIYQQLQMCGTAQLMPVDVVPLHMVSPSLHDSIFHYFFIRRQFPGQKVCASITEARIPSDSKDRR